MSDVSEAIAKLSQTVEQHREQERVTCRKNCWCWDAEALLIALEAAATRKAKVGAGADFAYMLSQQIRDK